MNRVQKNLHREINLEELEEKLNIEFEDKELLRRAVTHRSFPNENKDLNLKDNERLEFLGDSVLGLSISTHLFKNFSDASEGKLAKVRANLVSADMLSRKARELDLNNHLLLGHGEEITGGRDRDSILADTLEALLGAIYLERDFNVVDNFIIDFFEKDIELVWSGRHEKDYKTLLQETVQESGEEHPEYSVISEEGPDHNKFFHVEVKIPGKKLGRGRGSSKKEAEQEAARAALQNMDEL